MAKKENKQQVVEEIRARFEDSDAALLTEYRGLTVGEISELRTALREANTDYKVLKNTLARIAVREVGLEDLAGSLVGPTAIAFVKGDAVAAAKALDDAVKKFPVLVVKGGVISGKVIDAEGAKELAKLEPREVQLAKIAMLFNTPLQQTVNVFAALLRDFGSMLAQVLAKKESGELPAGDAPAAAAPAEEAPAQEAPAAEAEDPGRGETEAAEVAADTAEAPSAEEAVGTDDAQAAPTEETETAEGDEN
jgi:large subunit ribosomal protein L10